MSNRALTAGMLAAIATGSVRPLLLYEGEFSGAPLRLFTGYGTLAWNGNTFTGAGQILRITDIQEVSELQAVNFTVSLNGELPSLIAIALGQVRRGKSGSVWLGLLDSAGALIADPFLCFRGRADKPGIVPDPVHTVISVAYESRLIDAARRRERRYTSEDQQIDYPADLGFDYVPSLQDTVFAWGRR
jgi:hypothetical protein